MMTLQGMRLILLVFALAGFGGAGAALAMARYRAVADGERDLGLLGIASMFAIFGALCTIAASGFFGVLAFGGVVTGAAYLLMGQRVGLFRIEAQIAPPPEREPTEHHTP